MADRIKDGGPAFPIWTPDMNVSKDAGPGMSKRDWFAGQALAGLCANPGGPYQANSKWGWGLTNCTAREVAHEAVALADALIEALAHSSNGGGDD